MRENTNLLGPTPCTPKAKNFALNDVVFLAFNSNSLLNRFLFNQSRCSLYCLKRPPSLLNQSHSFAGSEPRFPFWLASDTDKPNWTARDRSTGRHQGTIVVSHKAFSWSGLTFSPFLLAADTAAARAIAFTRPGFQLLHNDRSNCCSIPYTAPMMFCSCSCCCCYHKAHKAPSLL